jgi:hypothetical protein
MPDEPQDVPPPDGPVVPPETADQLFAQAEDFRHRQVWEEAIRLYRFCLQKDPARLDAAFGLAQTYEGKAREPGYESYAQSAMAEYRRITILDPSSSRAHDALLAAGLKADSLDELLADYKSRLAKAGEQEVFRSVIRKIEALLLLKAAPVKVVAFRPPPFIAVLFGLLAPGVAVLSIIASLILRLKGGQEGTAPLIAAVLMKVSVASFIAFVAYKLYVSWRSTR